MPERLRALIVDDEKPARQKLRRFLQSQPDIEIAGEAGDGLAALEMIRRLSPDLVLLDIQMPGLTGFEVIDSFGPGSFPYVIFVTAYDEYALKAFEIHAVDYLLKPFTDERLATALEHFRSRRHSSEEIINLLQSLSSPDARLERVLIRDGERIVPVRLEEVLRISAEEKYVRLHLAGKSYLYRAPLSGLAERLDPRRFVRVHRSEVVNVDFIAELQPWSHGDYIVVLKDGKKIPLSRTYREQALRALGA